MSDWKEIKKERIRKVCDKDIIRGDDGYHVFWPEGMIRGALSSLDLKLLAEIIDELNAPWEQQMREYFEGEQQSVCS